MSQPVTDQQVDEIAERVAQSAHDSGTDVDSDRFRDLVEYGLRITETPCSAFHRVLDRAQELALQKEGRSNVEARHASK